MSTDISPEAVDAVAETVSLEPRAATLAELKQGCPGAASDFLLAQLERKATLQEAQTAWIAEQQALLQAAREEAEAAARKASSGVEPLQDGAAAAEPGGSAMEQFWARVDELVAQGHGRPKAIRSVAVREPELHQAFLDEYNAGRK